jgi:hypothetical protein
MSPTLILDLIAYKTLGKNYLILHVLDHEELTSLTCDISFGVT